MSEKISRRRFLEMGGAAVIGNVLPKKTEAAEDNFQFLSSTMTQEMLESQKEAAIASLVKSIPPDSKLDYLRAYTAHLREESQMYIPDPEELEDVVTKSKPRLEELATQIEISGFGLFVFADIDQDGNHFQRLYVLRRGNNNEMLFVKAYRVSTAGEFGNEKDSEKTPLGLHTIHSGKKGLFGEVVSMRNKYKDLFNYIVYNGKEHWFVKGFGKEPGNDAAEVVTDQYLLQGPETDTSRGIRIHGTNRSGFWDAIRQKWVTFLGGKRRSGACIRMSNTDIRDLGLSEYIWSPGSLNTNKVVRKTGSPVMIYATEKTINRVRTAEDEKTSNHPPRWKPIEEEKLSEDQEIPKQTPERKRGTSYRPPRWKPIKEE